MQFARPELLFALFAIIIPILIHLFQLRRFKIEPFTNVLFLKKIKTNTRKSSTLKKWLILILRIFTISSIVIAFAKPYESKFFEENLEIEIVIYIDNSFSMEARGVHGPLLKRTIQELLTYELPSESITVFTNNNSYKNYTKKELKKLLPKIDYSETQLPIKDVLTKADYLFSKKTKRSKYFILISDFQKKNRALEISKNLDYNLLFVNKKPKNNENNYIDNIKITSTINNYEINIQCKTNNDTTSTIALDLYNKNRLIGKSILKKSNDFKTQFNLPNNESILGKFQIKDGGLSYDNEFYFNIKKEDKISVLSIGNNNHNYFQRVFTSDEFIIKHKTLEKVNLNELSIYDLIIVDEIKNLPNSLIFNLKSFIKNNGTVLLIPSVKGNLKNYNNLIEIKKLKLESFIENENRITEINFKHPIFKRAFKKNISNFLYPKAKTYFNVKGKFNSLLELENGKSFLLQKDNLFIFSAAISNENSNFTNSPIIVPTLYGLGKSSFKSKEYYYSIGSKNQLDIKYRLKKDDIVEIKKGNKTYIPLQINQNSKIKIKFDNLYLKSGHYALVNKNDTIQNLSFNFKRDESLLDYHNTRNLKSNFSINSLKNTIESIKSEVIVDGLWKWFVIFALIFLILEILILKIFE